MDWAAANGTALVADTDYQTGGGTLTFAADVTTRTFTVLVNGDARNETDETFRVGLANPSNAAIDVGTGTGTIVNDDQLPKLSIDSVSHNEGDSGTTTYTFTAVSLSAVSGRTVSVD